MYTSKLYLGNSPLLAGNREPTGDFTQIAGREWYKITHYDTMPPFFMSITNSDNIWIYLSSTGGITAGRTSKDSAVFPYATVDRVTESHTTTGAYSALLVSREGETRLWEPLRWGDHRIYNRTRTIYKSVHGTTVIFEEENQSLDLVFRTGWEATPRYGIHRFAELKNIGATRVEVRLLDGIRNILPGGVSALFNASFSNLLDAYKRSEGWPDLGIFSLSATPTDLAEPSESLSATTVWSYGLEESILLLSDRQIASFVRGEPIDGESDIKGVRGSFLQATEMVLQPDESRDWGLCADPGQDHAAVVSLRQKLGDKRGLVDDLKRDLDDSRIHMSRILANNDGLQQVGSKESKHHHAANVLFNVMRGGYFYKGYSVSTADFADFVLRWDNRVYESEKSSTLSSLPEICGITELAKICAESENLDLHRLALEYLPLTFSRRHGDPSRPWNEFSIVTRDPDGLPIIGYQGNWRDIFQNWEALCLSYPSFLPSIIAKFLNATTIDGYNPYRISQDGIDWEVPDPDNPWQNIGYWGDHQIVYLARLMEHAVNYLPGAIEDFLEKEIFVYADVPYRIKPFEELVADPYHSIVMDMDRDAVVRQRAGDIGSDGKLVPGADRMPLHGTMAEKLLILLLAKAANYVAGGGIWLNTQRPEWNDANNALAGWGLSLVTLTYLLRYIELLEKLFPIGEDVSHVLHSEVAEWLEATSQCLEGAVPTEFPIAGHALLVSLGRAASEYRSKVYGTGFSGSKTSVKRESIRTLLGRCKRHFAATFRQNRLPDGTIASYQILTIGKANGFKQLYPMLEGQVAAISSSVLNEEDVITIIDALKSGPLYRKDLNSYMLYPNRPLPGFLEKNVITQEDASALGALGRPEREWKDLLASDADGQWHFNHTFRNVGDLRLASTHLSDKEQDELAALFEKTFNHAAFTGRSGTFFGFEGLGSVYWHMVSKLLLAVLERLIQAVLNGAEPGMVEKLKERYVDIRSGLGFNKTPKEYGAFPTDPYSHTPWGHGAKQPGMTGQVKEEIIARYGELGLVVRDGRILFLPAIILDDQWRTETQDFEFSFCGVVITVARGAEKERVLLNAGTEEIFESLEIPQDWSSHIFSRDGKVKSVRVNMR